ncbi:MAG: hypothetical protein LBU97_03695 [Alistipes sp.]|jgi:hypothetical protein|nr:hypothetical protein [Alistipes sp.]
MALFFSQRKPRGFNYSPRYYDPETDAREERKKIVLGEKYRTPEQRKRDEARAAGEEVVPENYVPGAYLREHISARRNTHASESMRKRRKKTRSVPMLVLMLAVIALVVWMLYFK